MTDKFRCVFLSPNFYFHRGFPRPKARSALIPPLHFIPIPFLEHAIFSPGNSTISPAPVPQRAVRRVPDSRHMPAQTLACSPRFPVAHFPCFAFLRLCGGHSRRNSRKCLRNRCGRPIPHPLSHNLHSLAQHLHQNQCNSAPDFACPALRAGLLSKKQTADELLLTRKRAFTGLPRSAVPQIPPPLFARP